MLLNWLRKKAPPVASVSTPSRLGFFSTDTDLDAPRPQRFQQALARTFQRQIDTASQIDANGDTFAMDDAGQPQSIKMLGGVGQTISEGQFLWYASQGFIGHQVAAMLAQHWLIDKACAMPAKDAVRHGFDITVNNGDEIDSKILDAMRQADKRLRLKHHLVEFVRNGRIFGIRIALFAVRNAPLGYYENPFNPDGVKKGSYLGIVQIDPYWCAPELDTAAVSNPLSPNFYEPTWWRIGGQRVHRSHLVIFRNGEVPDVLKPSYLFGGIPVPQKIAERVYASERTANEAPLLAMTKRLTALHLDVEKALANQQDFERKMEIWTQYRDNFGVKILGTEEVIEQFDTTLADLDATIMTQYQIVAAAAEVPATKLLGTTPKGFNATGEYDEKSYHEGLETIQEHDLTPLAERHYLMLIRSEIAPGAPFEVTVNWKPTDSPTAKELAETNNVKAQTDSALSAAGAIDGADIRQRLIADPDSGYNGIDPIVPGGPGDREAEQEDDDDGEADSDEAQDEFDPDLGRLDGARLITHQRFLDRDIVAEKLAARDFMVNVTPEFEIDGKAYRMILDGHHSLAAARQAGVEPEFVVAVPKDAVFNAFTRQATDQAVNDAQDSNPT